mmetsp:Transcript_78656/g.218399  ORF Transcript_78656/g.218399 Transcript_78656/m.218399 type:complete len:545 (+) Transcript_78656:64-1698(+)
MAVSTRAIVASALLFAVLFAIGRKCANSGQDSVLLRTKAAPGSVEFGADVEQGFDGPSASAVLWAVFSEFLGELPRPEAIDTNVAPRTAAAYDWYSIEAAAATSGGSYLSHDNFFSVDLWKQRGENQLWRITLWEGDEYHIEAAAVTNGGRTFLSHDGHQLVDLWRDPGSMQTWRIREVHQGVYTIQAAAGTHGRSYLSHNGASQVDLWSAAGANQLWRIPGLKLSASKRIQQPISPGCADPFAWHDSNEDLYHLICTGGRLPHYTGKSLDHRFQPAGFVLPERPQPLWSQDGRRWAPETVQVGADNFVFFSSPSSGEPRQPHRIGWARADGSTGASGKWSHYAEQDWFHAFPKTAGGEIDPHVFQELNSGVRRYYLLWKTDDNAVGRLTTRLWMQEMDFNDRKPRLQGSPRVILESWGLWWVSSWTPGGSLIEGPELVKRGGYYYLFFASGRFCKPDYAEGVARSRRLWGPYEKGENPVLSTGRVGYVPHAGGTPKIVGPGHAGFVEKDGTWYMVWHGSPGYNCDRMAFVSPLSWEDGWPRVA